MKPKNNPDDGVPSGPVPETERALDILDHSETSFTSAEFARELSRQLGLGRAQSRKLLTRLVREREISYQDLYGSTRVMRNFFKPVRITPHFTLTPPDQTPEEPNSRIITIAPGISFGSGHHPTTQLCLELLDFLLFDTDFSQCHPGGHAADVGTGSAVLALAACHGGMAGCRAWEIDPVSVNEARKNIQLNHMAHCIELTDDFMPPCPDEFALLMANLRYPTLKQLRDLFIDSLTSGGQLILSGFREWETPDLLSSYQEAGFTPEQIHHRKNWGAVLLRAS